MAINKGTKYSPHFLFIHPFNRSDSSTYELTTLVILFHFMTYININGKSNNTLQSRISRWYYKNIVLYFSLANSIFVSSSLTVLKDCSTVMHCPRTQTTLSILVQSQTNKLLQPGILVFKIDSFSQNVLFTLYISIRLRLNNTGYIAFNGLPLFAVPII